MRILSNISLLTVLFHRTEAFAPPSSHLHKTFLAPEYLTKDVSPESTINRISNVALPKGIHCPRAESSKLFGIPKMFRWLTDQYPNINRRLNEGLSGDTVVDNFYLDMNGIIHPCTHGNSDDIVILDETAMFKKIFGYVDRLYKIVRPRKVLYLAVDGVAPRAKMNQQRSRRFRSSREAEELAATILARDGKLPEGKSFDSNCITPGTDFMLKLSIAMTKWIEFKQKTDPFWKNGADVVFTGPNVPGEGEHKVMDYIRECKEQYDPENPEKCHPHWSPEMTHVLYGLDADLIMLGLITHEPTFMLLREKMSVVMAGRGRHKHRKKKDMLEYTRDDFELLELKALRQMFQIQFRKFADSDSFGDKHDSDRIIDDFVFMAGGYAISCGAA
uniref:Xrn1 N-terminal domain-containing protein n=1 Tax=Chaetoceros debilis TaxID=122233 RepID=A0A7S3PYG8_9STRA